MKAVHLKTEYMTNPRGIDVVRPRLSWICEGGIRQTAYEIRAVLCGVPGTAGSGNQYRSETAETALPEMAETGAREAAKTGVREAAVTGIREVVETGVREAAETGAREAVREIWNSGRVKSDRMNAVYGAAAESRQHIFWQVRLWDEEERAGEWSEPAEFEMGLLNKNEFKAKWINPEPDCEPACDSARDPAAHKPASYLKTHFEAHPDGKAARLYITCHGLYEAFLNGSRVGNFVLAPGTDTYDKKLAYQTYDVTDLLSDGTNDVLVILGDGWYRSCSGVDGDRNLYGEDVSLYFQLEIDGSPVCISDEGWEATQEGPIRENDMQQGEVYNALKEELTGWHGVTAEYFGLENLSCSNCVPVVEKERFPGRIITTPNGETVIDYGQNLAGYVEFTVQAHAGDRIVMTHGEALDENGNFTAENFQDRKRHKEGGIRQQVVYTCKEGLNHYKSRFTIWGFRYAKAETAVDLSKAEFTSVAVYSDMEQTGWFECSDRDVNQLVKNSLWSMKSNFCDVPTDCPTRERAAWTGDMGVFAETGLYLADCYPVIRKWLAECRLNQYEDGRIANIAPRNNIPSFFSRLLAGSVGWGDACIIVPYELYKRNGDLRILEENYEMMKGWYRYLNSRAGQKGGEAAGIRGMSGTEISGPKSPDLSHLPEEYLEKAKQAMTAGISLPDPEAVGGDPFQAAAEPKPDKNPYADYTIETGVDYGEWCEPDVKSQDFMSRPQSGIATAYYARSGRMLAEIAGLLGEKEDAAYYREIAENAAGAFRWIAVRDGKIHSDRQADYVRAISFGLLDKKEAEQAAADLNRLIVENGCHLNTGFLSTPSLCGVLTEYGYRDTACRLLLQDTMPGWLYAVKKGATTIWENWDSINEKGEVKASLNHYSYGAVCGWLFSDICGIRVENGTVTVRPTPCPPLKNAHAVYQSPVGEIVSGWNYEEEKAVCTVTIPANGKAVILWPDGSKREAGAGTYIWRE